MPERELCRQYPETPVMREAFGGSEKKMVGGLGIQPGDEEGLQGLKNPADQPLFDQEILIQNISRGTGRRGQQTIIGFSGFLQRDEPQIGPQELRAFADHPFREFIQAEPFERDVVDALPAVDDAPAVLLLRHGFVLHEQFVEHVGYLANPFLLLVVEAPAVLGVDIEHPGAVSDGYDKKSLDMGLSLTIKGECGCQGRGNLGQLVHVNGMPHFMNLGQYPALFHREGDRFGQEFTQSLRRDHFEVARFGIYDEEGSRIRFQNVAQKAHERLVRMGTHKGTRLSRMCNGNTS